MAGAADRPVPRAGAIDPAEKVEILRELLAVERARLRNALALEEKRNIVFPETTVIVKDIERIVAALSGRADAQPEEQEATDMKPNGKWRAL